jgi:pimeloyl-ACP methyl ester carboxylesterase
MRALKIVGIVLICLILLVSIGPFLVPVPPLQATAAPEALADAESRFIRVRGLNIHYKVYGSGEPVMILLHGFGASTFSWREVVGPLSQIGTVIVYDRPAFGLTERPLKGEWVGQNPYSFEAQPDLLLGLMDALGVEKSILIGHSAGGTVSVQMALTYPERVSGLVLVDAAVFSGGGALPGWLDWLKETPQADRLGPLLARTLEKRGDDFIRSSWHDPAGVTEEVLAGYRKPLQVANWDRALWELTKAARPLNLPDRLSELNMSVLVMTGDDDRIVPTEQGIALSQKIPGAQLAIIANCGHLPHEERPEEFLAAVLPFVRSFKGE